MKHLTTLLLMTVFLSACGNYGAEDAAVPGPIPIVEEPPIPDMDKEPLSDLGVPENITLLEGGEGFSFDTILEGANITDVTLQALTLEDSFNISGSAGFNADVINITLTLDYAIMPIMPHIRTFILTVIADGQEVTTTFSVNIIPTAKADVYLTAGQSNMVGITGNVRDDVLDATNDRILQLNVERNSDKEDSDEYTNFDANIDSSLLLVVAQDSLYDPKKDIKTVGLGLSFAKAALVNTTADIILVPAAQSSTAFCERSDPPGNWNSFETGNPELGNTWLYDRAVYRTNLAIDGHPDGGILRGILWHQGESDANTSECAALYSENMHNLIEGFRSDITGDNADVPFIAGTMSRAGEMNGFGENKTVINSVHVALPDEEHMAGIVINDDLIPSNGFACGGENFDDCIHFGAVALREMGQRYYTVLQATVNGS